MVVLLLDFVVLFLFLSVVLSCVAEASVCVLDALSVLAFALFVFTRVLVVEDVLVLVVSVWAEAIPNASIAATVKNALFMILVFI